MKNLGYKALAYEYDEFYLNKNYSVETDFITRFLKNEGLSILDVDCGTGNHMVLLEKQGFHVSGLDLNKEMLEVANNKVKGKLYQGDMSNFSLNKTFDAIICMFAAFNHLQTLENAQKTIQCFKNHLKEGGRLLIDLYNAKNSGSKLNQGKKHQRKMEWTYDLDTQLTKSVVSYMTSQGIVQEEPFLMRHFTMEELQDMLKNNGFKNIEFWDNFSDRKGTVDSKNLILTASLQ
jgi:ubiquinone/menaquinone biosynthesis C-methylase UbiE